MRPRMQVSRSSVGARAWSQGERHMREGLATNGYAAVAAANPYGLTAMRVRGVRYVWALLGVLVLAAMYTAPIVAVFRQPALPGRTTPLPNLAFPNVALPLLRVPKLHALAPLPARQTQASAAAAGIHPLQGVPVRRDVRHTLPVVTDAHTTLSPGTSVGHAKPKADPFAKVPTVSDDTGGPMALPTAQAAPAQAPTATAPDTTTTGTPSSPDFDASDYITPASAPARAGYDPHVMQQFDDSSPAEGTSTTTATSAPATTVTSSTPPDTTSSKPSSGDQTQTLVTGSTGSSNTVTSTITSTAPSTTTTGTTGSPGTLDTSTTAGTGTNATPTTTVSGSTGAGSGSQCATAIGDTTQTTSTAPTSGAGSASGSSGTAQTTASGATCDTTATATPTSATTAPPDPNANTSSGLSPPAGSGLITAVSGGSVTSADGRATVSFAPGAVASDVTVTVTAVPGPLGTAYDLRAVDAAGNRIDTFAIAPVLTISYAGTPPTGINYLDPTNGPQQIAATVDASAHTISAALPHFSSYASSDVFTVAILGLPAQGYQGTPLPVVAQVYDNTTKELSVSAPVQFSATAGTATFVSAGCTADGSNFDSLDAGLCPVLFTPTSSGTVTIQATIDCGGTCTVTPDSATINIDPTPGDNTFSSSHTFTVTVIGPGVAYVGQPLPISVLVFDDTAPNLTQSVPVHITSGGNLLVPTGGCIPNGGDVYLTPLHGLCTFIVTPVVPGAIPIIATVDGAASVTPGILAVAVLPVAGAWTVATGTNDSAAVTTDSKHLKVTLGDPVTYSVPLFDLDTTSTDAVAIDASASSLATTFDLSGIAAHFSNLVTVLGGSAGDLFNLGDGYGKVSITGAASDKLSFDQNTQSVDYNGTQFTDGVSGDQANVSGVTKIDLSLNGNTVTLADLETKLDSLFTAVAQAVTTIDAANAQLSAALPLLGLNGSSSIDKVVGFVDAFGGVAQQIHAHLVGFGHSTPTLQDVVDEINTILTTQLPQISAGFDNPLGNLQLSTSYGSDGAHLLFYVTATLTGGSFHRSIPLDFGSTLTSLGIALDGDPNTAGNQPPTFDITAGLNASLALGVDVHDGAAVVKPNSSVSLTVNAALTSA